MLKVIARMTVNFNIDYDSRRAGEDLVMCTPLPAGYRSTLKEDGEVVVLKFDLKYFLEFQLGKSCTLH